MKNNNILFITGTDTGVGKTRVALAVLLALRSLKVDAHYFKPVQSGASARGGDAGAAMQLFPRGTSCIVPPLYSFPLAASPHLAARLSGISIRPDKIAHEIRKQARNCDLLIVEGAGGLLVPLNGRETIADLIQQIHANVVIVSRNKLGTLNHTALTLREAKRRRLTISGVVINNTSPARTAADKLIRSDNLDALKSTSKEIRFVECPYSKSASKVWLIRFGKKIVKALKLNQ